MDPSFFYQYNVFSLLNAADLFKLHKLQQGEKDRDDFDSTLCVFHHLKKSRFRPFPKGGFDFVRGLLKAEFRGGNFF